MKTNCVTSLQKKSKEYQDMLDMFNMTSGDLELILQEYQSLPENQELFERGELPFPSEQYVQGHYFAPASTVYDNTVVEFWDKNYSKPIIKDTLQEAQKEYTEALQWFDKRSVIIKETKDGKYQVLVTRPVLNTEKISANRDFYESEITTLQGRNINTNYSTDKGSVSQSINNFKQAIKNSIKEYNNKHHVDSGVETKPTSKITTNIEDNTDRKSYVNELSQQIINKLEKTGYSITITPVDNLESTMNVGIQGKVVYLNYNPKLVSIDSKRIDYIIAHELVHTVTANAVDNVILNKGSKEETKFVNDVWDIITDLNNNHNLFIDYGYNIDTLEGRAKHVKEFIANVMTNPILQDTLSNIKTDKKTSILSKLYNKLKQFLSKYLGKDINGTYLEKAISTISLHIDKGEIGESNASSYTKGREKIEEALVKRRESILEQIRISKDRGLRRFTLKKEDGEYKIEIPVSIYKSELSHKDIENLIREDFRPLIAANDDDISNFSIHYPVTNQKHAFISVRKTIPVAFKQERKPFTREQLNTINYINNRTKADIISDNALQEQDSKIDYEEEQKFDTFNEGVVEDRLTQQINSLTDTNSPITSSEVNELSRKVTYKLSDTLTQIQQNPRLAATVTNGLVTEKDLEDIDSMSRLELLQKLGIRNVINFCRDELFSYELDEETGEGRNPNITEDDYDVADLLYDNFDALIQLGIVEFAAVEGFGIKIDSNGNAKAEEVDMSELNPNEDKEDKDAVAELEGDTQESWQVDSRTLDVLQSMSQIVKQALLQCYKTNPDGSFKVDRWGLYDRLDARECTNSILKWVQGSVNLSTMIEKLEAQADKNPWLKQILPRLKDKTGDETVFQSQFFGVFSKYVQLYDIIKNADGSLVSIPANSAPALSDAKRAITALYNIGEHPLFTSSGSVNEATLQEIIKLHDELTHTTYSADTAEEIADKLAQVISGMGYPTVKEDVLSVLDKDVFHNSNNLIGYIIKALEKNKKNEKWNPFSGKVSDNGIIGNIGKLITPITDKIENTIPSSFYTNGKMYQTYTIPSYLTKLFQNFRKSRNIDPNDPTKLSDFNKWLNDEYGQIDWFRYKDRDGANGNDNLTRGWRNSMLQLLATDPEAARIFEHKVNLTFNGHGYMHSKGDKAMDDIECTLSILTEYWRETTKQSESLVPAWFRVPMLSNKPSSEFIKFYSYRGANYKNNITKALKLVFDQELSRIQTVKLRKENYSKGSDVLIKNFDTKRGDKFCFLDFIEKYRNNGSELGKLINDKVEGKEVNEAKLNKLALETIAKEMDLRADSILKEWKTNGTMEAAKRIKNIDVANIEESLRNFIWNDFLATTNISELLITDKAYYEDTEDEQKRMAQVHSPGIRANIEATDFDGKRVSDGRFRTIILKDFDSYKSNIIDNLRVIFDRKLAEMDGDDPNYIAAKETFDKIIESYEEVNVADAEGYSSPSSLRKKMFMFGKWDRHSEEIYKKLRSGDYKYQDLQFAFQPLKPFVFSSTVVSTRVEDAPLQNMKVNYQYKNSEYLLMMADAIISGENTGKPNLLGALYAVMEQSMTKGGYDKGIDTIQFESTTKAGLSAPLDLVPFLNMKDGTRAAIDYINDRIYKDGKYNDIYVHESDFTDYCIQQEVPEHFKNHEQAHGSQIRMIIPSDLNPNTTYSVEGRNLSAEEFRREYEETIAENIQDSIDQLARELNLTGTPLERNQALSAVLKREILSSPRYGVDLLLACSLNEDGEFRIPLGDPVQSKRVEQLINSIIKNRINKQKIAGGPVVQVSNFGTSRQLNIVFKDKNGKLLKTRSQFEKEKKKTSLKKASKPNPFKINWQKNIVKKEGTYNQVVIPKLSDELVQRYKHLINVDRVQVKLVDLSENQRALLQNKDKAKRDNFLTTYAVSEALNLLNDYAGVDIIEFGDLAYTLLSYTPDYLKPIVSEIVKDIIESDDKADSDVSRQVDLVSDALDKELSKRGIPSTKQPVKKASAVDFHNAIKSCKKENQNGWIVDVHEAADYENDLCLLTEDGKAGIAITKDGDIISVFSAVKHDHRLNKLMQMAIAAGGKKLDCYYISYSNDSGTVLGGLPVLYADFGFTADAVTPFNADYAPTEYKEWKENNPNLSVKGVAAMSLKTDNSIENFGKFDSIELSSVKEFDGETGYDDALNFRDNILSELTKQNQSYEEYVKENQAGVAYYEVFAPIYSDELLQFMDENGNIDIKAVEATSPELLDLVTYRIPTEDKYSCAPCKIVGFMPREAGEGIMMPYEITTITGSDYDVDKMYIMRKDLPIFRKKNKEIADILIDKLGKSKRDDIKMFLNQIGTDERKAVTTFPDIAREYRKIAFEVKKPTEGRRYRNNKIIDMSLSVLTHEDTTDKLLNPGGFDQQKRTGYMVQAYRMGYDWDTLQKMSIYDLKEACYTEKNLSFIDTHVQFYKQNSVAGSILSIFAVAKVAHATLESNYLRLNAEALFDLDYQNPIKYSICGLEFINGMEIDAQKNINGEYIGKILGSLVASAADAVKDPILNLMNINVNTVNVLNAAIRMGLPFEDAALLLSSNVITRALKNYSIKSLENPSLYFNNIVDIMLQKYAEKIGDTSKIDNEPLTREEIIQSIKEGDDKINYKILLAYSRLSKVAQQLKMPSFVTRFNSISSAVGPLILDNLITEEKLLDTSDYVTLGDGKTVITADSVAEMHPILNNFMRTLGIARNLFGNKLPANSNTFRRMFNRIPDSFKKRLLRDRKAFGKLSDFFQSYLLVQSGCIDYSECGAFVEQFPKYFIKRGYKDKFKDNFLIQSMRVNTDSNSGRPFLRIDTTGLDQSVKDKLSSAWIDLYKSGEEGKKLAISLFKYNFFKGGIGFSPKTFMNLLPVQLKEMIPGYVTTFRGDFSLYDDTVMLDQFVQNNWHDKSIVPRVKVKTEPDEKGLLFHANYKLPYFVNSADDTLWKKISDVYSNRRITGAIFAPLTKLGNKGEFMEMSVDEIKNSALKEKDAEVLKEEEAWEHFAEEEQPTGIINKQNAEVEDIDNSENVAETNEETQISKILKTLEDIGMIDLKSNLSKESGKREKEILDTIQNIAKEQGLEISDATIRKQAKKYC